MDEKKQKAALALKKEVGYSIREICAIVGISRNTDYKYTRAAGQPSPPQQRRKESKENQPAHATSRLLSCDTPDFLALSRCAGEFDDAIAD